MKNNMNSIIIDNKDNVAMTLCDIKLGDLCTYSVNGEPFSVKAYSDIPVFHKFAIKDINKECPVIKYGEIIGIAKNNIYAGEHVHIHNIYSEVDL